MKAGEESKGVELHFQDEEEFPDLRVGQDRAGGTERHPSSISYSSIVSQVSQTLHHSDL